MTYQKIETYREDKGTHKVCNDGIAISHIIHCTPDTGYEAAIFGNKWYWMDKDGMFVGDGFKTLKLAKQALENMVNQYPAPIGPDPAPMASKSQQTPPTLDMNGQEIKVGQAVLVGTKEQRKRYTAVVTSVNGDGSINTDAFDNCHNLDAIEIMDIGSDPAPTIPVDRNGVEIKVGSKVKTPIGYKGIVRNLEPNRNNAIFVETSSGNALSFQMIHPRNLEVITEDEPDEPPPLDAYERAFGLGLTRDVIEEYSDGGQRRIESLIKTYMQFGDCTEAEAVSYLTEADKSKWEALQSQA